MPVELSARRRTILDVVLKGVLRSDYGDPKTGEKFKLISADWDPTEARFKGVTTCGYLPSYVAKSLGARGAILSAGLNQLRDAAKLKNAWVRGASKFTHKLQSQFAPDAERRPLPGDFYALCTGSSPDGLIVHVGVIVDASTNLWRTADAGQGLLPAQFADYVTRQYDPQSGTLTGEVTHNALRPARLVAGWVDIDTYFDGAAVEAGRTAA